MLDAPHVEGDMPCPHSEILLEQYDEDSQNHIGDTNAMVPPNDKFMPPQNRQDNYPALDAVLTCGATWPCPGMPNITICAPDIF